MPRVSAWTVRFSLVYLGIGFSLGGLLLSNKGLAYLPVIWILLPVHVEILMVGWVIQFALGVANWILPRFRGGIRGNAKLAWLALALLNTGILLSTAGTLLIFKAAVLAGHALEGVGAGLFLLNLWRRVKPLEMGREKINHEDTEHTKNF
jgi:hypothetical protein